MSLTSKYVCIAPDNLFKGNKKSGFIKLKHPKTDEPTLFFWDDDKLEIYEVQQHFEPHRSWFLGDVIKKDGRLYIFTRMDPIFFLIPILQNNNVKFTPLDHLLVGKLSILLSCNQLASELIKIADVKESAGFKVCRYNETLLLSWMKERVDRVRKTIDQRPGFEQENDAGNHDSLELSWALISEYLPHDTSLKLAIELGLELDKPVMPITQTENQGIKKTKFEAPVEDYTNSLNKENFGKKSASKAKKPPPVGSQAITSFFMKKKV